MRYLILGAVLALALLVAGCTSTPGSLAHATLADVSNYPASLVLKAPVAGHQFVLADFAVTNDGPTTYKFNPNYAHLIDPSGYQYSYSWESSRVPEYFGVTDIFSGETVRGKLLFEVQTAPAGTKYRLTI